MPWILSIISGLLIGFSFPRYGVSIFAWFAFVPLLLALRNSTNGKSYVYGFLTGIIANIIILYWVVVAMNKYGGINIIVSIIALILLSIIMSGLYYGTFTFIINLFGNASIVGEFIYVPVLWVLLEYIKTFLFSGFPWELLGYSQYRDLALIQVSRFTGVYGVSFIIMLFNTLLYEIIVWWYDIERIRTAKYPWIFLKVIAVFLLITVSLVYGEIKMDSINNAIKKTKATLNVSLIQGNIDQSIKWNRSYQSSTMAEYFSLTDRAIKLSHTDLVIWPETATPFFFQSTSDYGAAMSDFVKTNHVYLLFGSPAYKFTHKGVEYFNSAFLMSPSGNILGRYNKRHLVPFGEYLPLKHVFFFLKKLTSMLGDFTPGKSNQLLHYDNVKAGILICYEIIFPQLSQQDSRDGANLLVTITDDAWFGDTSAPYQHLSMAVFRAVENDRFVVRAANTGISAVISPTGKILEQTKLFVPGFINYRVALINTKTFYTLNGDLFVLICAVIFIVFVVVYAYKFMFIKKG